MSSNSGSGLQNLSPENLFNSVSHFFTNNKTLDFLMNRGAYDIPYGFMGIATIAAGTFTYVTYQDYANEVSTGISETLDSIQSTELFIPSAETENSEPLFPTSAPEPDEIVNDDVIIAQEEPDASEESEKKPDEEEVKEKEPSAPEESKKKEEEPGEKYKMGGKSKKRRKTKRKKTKSKRKV
jgi:hypothetical protein